MKCISKKCKHRELNGGDECLLDQWDEEEQIK